jgi:hypothetical protein
LKDSAMKFMVEIMEGPHSTPSDPGIVIQVEPFDPPCMVVGVGGISQLPDFS